MSTLTFVRQLEEFSIYRTDSGESVYLANAVGCLFEAPPFTRYLTDLDEIDLDYTWKAMGLTREPFLAFLRAVLIDADEAVAIQWCVSCSDIAHIDDGSIVDSGGFACDSCVDNYYTSCDRCEALVTEVSGTLHDSHVCSSCLGNYYTYCDYCDGYHHVDDSSEHAHGRYDCCDSPAVLFSIRNDGEEPLANDVKVTVTLPAGVIDDEGLNRIRDYLYRRDMREERTVLTSLGNHWQTREGNFTKRFSRAVYKRNGTKVDAEALSMIGTIAAEHSRAVDFTVEVTRELNGSPEDFFNEGSCWWAEHATSRCALKTNGGFALLTHSETGWGLEVNGRAWVVPMKSTPDGGLTPTFETMTPAAFVVFNGYGKLEGYTGARMLSHMAGMTYRRISFSCDPMYINAGGYLVAPEEIASKYTDGALYLSTAMHSSLFKDEQVIDLTQSEPIYSVA